MRWLGGVSAALAALTGLALARAAARGSAPYLLFWEGRAVRWDGQHGVVVAPNGDLIATRPGPHAERLAVEGRSVLDAAVGRSGTLWLVQADGAILHRASDGAVTDVGATPFDHPTLAASGGALWAARSPAQFTFRPEPDTAPMALRLDPALRPVGAAGRVTVPANPFLAQLANSGHLVRAPGGGVAFAPFIRDEVVAFDRVGGVRWRVTRGLAHQTPDPTLIVARNRSGTDVAVDYAPVNLGLAEGPDGTIYVLSTVAARTDSSRLDALDPASGAVRHTWRFATAVPTLQADRHGTVRRVNPASLLPDTAHPDRAAFPPFALPTPGGDTLNLADLAGTVVLVNFWASWCGPCRDEFPALDSLAGTLGSARVRFLALSDDVRGRDAERFLREHPVRHLAIAFGGGGLKNRYRYFGLPTTVLLDGRGRVIRSWVGFAGARQLTEIASAIVREVGETRPPAGHVHRH